MLICKSRKILWLGGSLQVGDKVVVHQGDRGLLSSNLLLACLGAPTRLPGWLDGWSCDPTSVVIQPTDWR